jgi:DUF438 domain-containing protein
MSEFTNHKEERVAAFADFTKRLIAGAKGRELMEEYRFLFHTLVPDDIITAVDRLFQMEIPLEDLKVGLNKMLNLFQIRIKEYPALKPEKDSFLDLLNRNNAALKEWLAVLRPKNTQINRDPSDAVLRKELLEGFREVEQFVKMYEIKENVLFPALEKHWDDWRCAQVMWSYHDDIRVELKGLIAELEKETFDVKAFNKFLGDSYYNMHTIIFRDDYILIPVMLERMSAEVLAELTRESRDQEFPFVKPARKKPSQTEGKHPDRSLPVDLGTGVVTPEQIALMFNHLPVDITYVDENDEVRYFSSPKKRVFHRSISIIGRKVQNCHPPDSVHIVEKIVEAFRKGEKDEASFWIHMRDDYLLIRYFAVRDAEGKFRGVLEVTQEIGEIQKIEGEKRLLDWEET